MSDLTIYVEHQRTLIEMDSEIRRLELEVKINEETIYSKGEDDGEYWDTFKDMKVIKAKWDLEFYKMNKFHMVELWNKKYPHLVEKYDMSVSEVVVDEVKTD